jgi:hypothetical protein
LAELCATNSGARCLDSRVNISAIEEGGSATGRLLRSDGAGGVSGEKPMARMQAIRERLRLDRCSPGASCQRARRLGGTPLSAPCLSRVFLDCSSIVPRLFLYWRWIYRGFPSDPSRCLRRPFPARGQRRLHRSSLGSASSEWSFPDGCPRHSPA